jgi:hypothetical protein
MPYSMDLLSLLMKECLQYSHLQRRGWNFGETQVAPISFPLPSPAQFLEIPIFILLLLSFEALLIL